MTLIRSACLAAALLSAGACAKRQAAAPQRDSSTGTSTRAGFDSATIARLCAKPESVKAGGRAGCLASDQSVIPWASPIRKP
jgi:hypothetical protein